MKIGFLFVVVSCVVMLALPANQAQGEEADMGIGETRWLMPMTWADWVQDTTAMADYIDAWKSRGLNGCGLQVRWDRIEPERGVYDWTWLDERLDLIRDADLSVHLRLQTQRARPAWVDTELMQDSAGKQIGAERGFSMLCFNDEQVLEIVPETMSAMAAHVRERYGPAETNPVVALMVQFSGPAETEYAHDEWSDFSPTAQRAFRVWLQTKFKDVGALNTAWGTRHGQWEQVTLQGAQVYDFFRFRTDSLAALISRCAAAVHRTEGIRMAVQFGSIWDGLSGYRGTRDACRLLAAVDMVVVDDYPLYDHRMSMDILRGQARDKIWGNEVDGPGIATDELALGQCLESLERGAHFMWVANWTAEAVRDRTRTFWEPAMEAVRQPRREVAPERAIILSLATVCRQEPDHGLDGFFSALYQELIEGGDVPVDIITDSCLAMHPEWLEQYTGGVYVPASQLWMTDMMVEGLAACPVPVYVMSDQVGLLNEYGQVRHPERRPRSK